MDFKQIEAFIAVAKYKSFSKAADSIFLSQPTISGQVSALERELDVQLFNRTSKEVALTIYGGAFLEYALDIINTKNAAISHMSSFTNHIQGKFTLAASSTPCNSIVPVLVESFSLKYPQVTFNILEMPSGDIVENILKFDCEIGLVGSNVKDERINSYRLTKDELVLISKPSLNIPDEITIEILLKHRFIFRERHSATRKSFEKTLLNAAIDINNLNIYCEVNSLDILLQLVKRGLGISIVSKGVCEDYISSGNIKASIIKDLDLRRYIYLITSSRRPLTPNAKAFFDICKDYYNFSE
jgi:DNA-binding transcriptional LysR family regulator